MYILGHSANIPGIKYRKAYCLTTEKSTCTDILPPSIEQFRVFYEEISQAEAKPVRYCKML